jgi:alkaline phosphatase
MNSSTPYQPAPAEDPDDRGGLKIETTVAAYIRRRRRGVVSFFRTRFIVLTALLFLAFLTTKHISKAQPKFVILMISDGMGPASLSLARTFQRVVQNASDDTQLPLDPYLVGSLRTHSAGALPRPSSNSLRVTDSCYR